MYSPDLQNYNTGSQSVLVLFSSYMSVSCSGKTTIKNPLKSTSVVLGKSQKLERRSFICKMRTLQRFPDDSGCQRETVTSINDLKEHGSLAKQDIHLYPFSVMQHFVVFANVIPSLTFWEQKQKE